MILRQLIWLVLFSVIVVLTAPFVHKILAMLLWMHQWIMQLLGEVFSAGKMGLWLRDIIAIIAIPFLLATIPTFFYWIVRGRAFPYFMAVVWVIWLLEVSALLALKG